VSRPAGARTSVSVSHVCVADGREEDGTPAVNVASFSTADCRPRSVVGRCRQPVVFTQDVVHRESELPRLGNEVDL